MNRDSTKPQTTNTQNTKATKPPADAGASASTAACTQSNRDGPPGAPPGASMWLRTPEDVLARIPFAIGFHPADSLVVIAINANGRSDLVVRADLPAQNPPPADTAAPADDAAEPAHATTARAATDRAATGHAATDRAAPDGTATAARDGTAEPLRATGTAGAAATTHRAASDRAAPDRAAPDRAATVARPGTAEPPRATGTASAAAATTHRAAPDRAASDRAASDRAASAAVDGAAEQAGATDVAAAINVDTTVAGFGRVTTEHSSADGAVPSQPSPGSPPSPADDNWPDFAHQLAAAMVHNGAQHTVLVAYTTSADLARSSTGVLAAALAASGIGLLDALWVDGSRWRSLACRDPQCCPAEGRPYDARASRIAVESVYHGDVAFSGEAELRRSIAPTRGLARFAMRRATARMDAEASRRYLRVEDEEVKVATAVQADGKAYVMRLVEGYLTDGTRPTDDEVAWAGMYLYDIQVRDAAWLRMTTQTAEQHVQLWREIGRRALPPYHVAPLALLAFAAWLSGDGPLARCAVDRVLASDPTYSMAHLIRNVVAAMVPPSVWPPDDWPAESGEAGEADQPQAE